VEKKGKRWMGSERQVKDQAIRAARSLAMPHRMEKGKGGKKTEKDVAAGCIKDRRPQVIL